MGNAVSMLGSRHFPRDFSEDDLARFSELFSGREKGFVDYRIDHDLKQAVYDSLSTPSSVYTVYHDLPMSRDVVLSHLRGEMSIGYFPIREDLSVSVILLSYHTKLSSNFTIDFQRELLLAGACQKVMILHDAGIPAVLEDFDRFVLRLWIFLKEPIHFLKARKLSKELMDAIGPSKSEVHLSPVLFTEPNGIDWVEKAIPLPLGKNPMDMSRRFFVDPKSHHTYQDQIKFLWRIQFTDINNIELFIKNRKDCLTVVNKNKNKVRISLKIQLRNRCNVFNYLVSKAESGRNLTDEEKRVLFYTAGFFDNDGKALHEILMQCPDYKEKSVERQRANLYPRPISCVRIRELLPSLIASVNCNCIFNESHIKLGRYPSPLLYILPETVPSINQRYSAAYATTKEIAQHYISVMQDVLVKQEFLHRLKNELLLSMKASSKSSLSIANWIFRLDDDGDLIINYKISSMNNQ